MIIYYLYYAFICAVLFMRRGENVRKKYCNFIELECEFYHPYYRPLR